MFNVCDGRVVVVVTYTISNYGKLSILWENVKKSKQEKHKNRALEFSLANFNHMGLKGAFYAV